jgi:hypothetical protein
MTYGSLVTQLLKDYEDVKRVNTELEKMGYKMGQRLIDEYMAKSNPSSGGCTEFHETAEAIAKVAFKMFLGITANVVQMNAEGTQYTLQFSENPLNDFVELPEHLKSGGSSSGNGSTGTGDTGGGLWYCNLLAGVIRGALEMVQMKVICEFVKCPLRGDDTSEIRVTLKEYLKETVPNDED